MNDFRQRTIDGADVTRLFRACIEIAEDREKRLPREVRIEPFEAVHGRLRVASATEWTRKRYDRAVAGVLERYGGRITVDDKTKSKIAGKEEDASLFTTA